LCLTDVDARATANACVDARSLTDIGIVEGIVCRGERLPFKDDSFDTVLMISSLEHFEDDHATLEDCRRILRPGGRVLITTDSQPTEPGLPLIPIFLPMFRANIRKSLREGRTFLSAVLVEHASLYRVRRRYNRESLRNVLSQTGFVVVNTKTLVKSRFSKALYELCVSARILSFDMKNPMFRFVGRLYPLVVHSESRSKKTDGYVIAAMAVATKNQADARVPTH
jgi:SAM-dependent methyltransferase